jgi:cytochrome b subunit of formate dehydrogenase
MTHEGEAAAVHYRRFDAFDRSLHAVLMTSFLGLAFTGLPLLFSGTRWASVLAGVVGARANANLHRVFAAVMIGCFLTHLGRLLERLYVKKDLGILWGPRSMVPQPRDIFEFIGHVKWFLGLGPRPKFDKFTYWEKFDYWAVFWGMGIIGGSGLLLWFPRLFANLVPGWVFNVALLIHGEEALLAVVFIFTVHFFNGHIRPEKFPMDTVIFTGVVTEDELKDDRPGEWERMVAEGGLEKLRSAPPSARLAKLGRLGGTAAVCLGFLMVVLTLWALFGHGG